MNSTNSTSVARKSASSVMRQYRTINYAYRRAYREGMLHCLPVSHGVRYRLIKHRGFDSQGLAIAWRTVGDAIGNAMLKVR